LAVEIELIEQTAILYAIQIMTSLLKNLWK